MYNTNNFDKHIIDWERCLILASNQVALAEDLLNLFVSQLKQELVQLTEFSTHGDISQYLDLIHKLYGGCCYCAVPEFQSALLTLESLPRDTITLSRIEALHPIILQQGLCVIHHYETVSTRG